MALDLRRERFFKLLTSAVIGVLFIALATFLMVIFSEKEKLVEDWPLGLTSCPTPACDHQ